MEIKKAKCLCEYVKAEFKNKNRKTNRTNEYNRNSNQRGKQVQ